MALTRVNVFLMRDSTTDVVDAIRSDKPFTQIDISPSAALDGAFFYQHSHANAPRWLLDVNTVLASDVTNVVTASASGVLVIRRAGRIFALAFGYGRSLLDPALIQRQFGLRAGLNLIDPSQLRSMDTKTFEDLVVSKSTQASKSSDLPAFGIDVARDILRGVAGIPRDKKLASRLAGSDSISLVTRTDINDVGALCELLFDAYNDTAYKANFEWIDQLEIVEDPAMVDALDADLLAALKARDTSKTYMAAPENIDWEDVESFSLAGTGRARYDDLDLDDYLGTLDATGLSKLTIELLKQRGVTVNYSRSGNSDRLWTLHECLISEQEVNGNLYVLIEGRWFAVNKTLSDRVDAYFNSLPTATSLASANPGETEPAYNDRVARAFPEEYLHLDAKIVRPGGASSGIEFCDLLAKDGTLIHVKRKSRSATLSHLFAQGTVSATTFFSDGVFRDALRDLVKKERPGSSADSWLDLIPPSTDTVDTNKYTVSYVVLAKPTKSGANWLPFFSKLNLMQHGTQLQTMRYGLTLSRLDN